MEWIILAIVVGWLVAGTVCYGVALRVIAPNLIEDSRRDDDAIRVVLLSGTFGTVLWPVTFAILMGALAYRLAKPLAPKDE